MISEKLQAAFNEQINKELYSGYLYLAMAAHFDASNLAGFAQWMKAQAQEEVGHAMKLYAHVVQRGGAVTLGAIAKPEGSWDSPLAVFEATYAHERMVTGLINDLVAAADAENDRAAAIYLEWFVTEQVEEEASADQVVQWLKMTKGNPHALLILDGKLGARTAGA